MSLILLAGKPSPLGSNVQDGGVNFALFSANATQVVLCIFDETGTKELAQYTLPQCTRQVWHGHLKGAQAGLCYGYRVYGPWEPELGHRFNPNKLLLDPYAKKLVGEVIEDSALYAYDANLADPATPDVQESNARGANGQEPNIHQPKSNTLDLNMSTTDSAPFMAKCQVVDLNTAHLAPITPLNTLLEKTVIYEMHVKGFSQRNPDIDASLRGSFTALGEPASIAYLQKLGITAVQLLPVQAFLSEAFLIAKGLNNYWGYNSIGFFAPHPAYLNQGDIFEFRQMVSKLHQAGIEVILDVVYNHTAEGNELGPSYSFRGIDNISYYRLNQANPRYYLNDTGCGNTVNLNHPQVLKLVMDSLRYWVQVMGVDGFRFDLATSLGREAYGFDKGAGFFDALGQDPVLSQVKLIAEPWDIGPGGYQLGNYPLAFSEWNDRYRDTMRRFWRGDMGVLPEFAHRFHGSSDLFEHDGRSPSASINFITSHDGFTLIDLLSYQDRHNLDNGEKNRDGHQENYSANYGVEGSSSDEDILACRARQQRNLLSCLLLSQGVPMLCAGDETGHSQQGNNNAYCQDNPLTWLDWQGFDQSLIAFVSRLIAIRKAFPALCARMFIHNSQCSSEPGFAWFSRQGEVMTKSHWSEGHNKTLTLILSVPKDYSPRDCPPKDDPLNDGALKQARLTACPDPEPRQALMLMLNANDCPHEFVFPALATLEPWQCLLSSETSESVTGQGVLNGEAVTEAHQTLMSHSLRLFYGQVYQDNTLSNPSNVSANKNTKFTLDN
jgi:isoamylase